MCGNSPTPYLCDSLTSSEKDEGYKNLITHNLYRHLNITLINIATLYKSSD